MLVESDVVDAVCAFITTLGYTVHQRLSPKMKGVDIIATRPYSPRELWVEAKGETSELESSKRFGKPFDSAQVNIHVAEAIYTALKHLASTAAAQDRLIGIALPSNELHHRYADAVSAVLLRLGIVIFWVRADKLVIVSPEGIFETERF